MSNRKLEPGYFSYQDCRIISHDGSKNISIGNLIYSLHITESMNLGSVRGRIQVLDMVNLIETFPLRGEETFSLTYEDAFGKKLSHEFHIYAVTDVEPNEQGTGQKYLMHFVEKSKLHAESHRISRAYQGKISDIVDQVFQEFYGPTQKITIEQTDGENTLIIPNYTPEETMFFLTKRAYSAKTPSQSFRFYQNRRGFFMVSDHYDRENSIEYTYNPMSLNDGPDMVNRMNEIIAIRNPKRVDTMYDATHGSYFFKTTELNFLTKSVEETPSEYFSENPGYETLSEKTLFKQTNAFIKEYLSGQNRGKTVVKDYPAVDETYSQGMRRKTFYPEILNNRSQYNSHMNTQMLITAYGRNDIAAGDIVTLNLPAFGKANANNEYVAGKYFVETITHNLVEDEWVMQMELTKLDWTKV